MYALKPHFASGLMRPRTKGYKLAYATGAAIITFFELVFTINNNLPFWDDFTVRAGCVLLLTAAPWIGLLGDLLFIALFIFINTLGYESFVDAATLGLHLIVIIWLIHHHWLAAICLFLGASLSRILLSDDPLEWILNEILLTTITLGIGFTLRTFKDRKDVSERSLTAVRQEAHNAVASVRRELAARLHDTIAKDLARVAITAQELAAAHPELAAEITPLARIAQDASHRLRPTIMDLNLSASAPSLRFAVKESASMLRTRKLVLDVRMAADIDNLLSRQAMRTAALFVREAATNALKYSKGKTTVELHVDIHSDEVSLTMLNQISKKPANLDLTGGFGLANLQSRIASEGGRMSFVSTGTQWLINAAIPNLQTKIEGKDNV